MNLSFSCILLIKTVRRCVPGITLLMVGAIAGALCVFPVSVMAKKDPERAGWIEEVLIYPGAIPLEAKLDTGAKSASIHAENLSTFTRDGEDWVKFQVTGKEGRQTTFERKVQRIVKIKRHNKPPAKRPVILLGICLGDHYAETEVNLADRSNYNYPLLIGRLYLADHFLIDSSATHQLKSGCPVESTK